MFKFVFSKKATKIDEIFTVVLTVCIKCQIPGKDFFKFCGLFRKHELYYVLGSKLDAQSVALQYCNMEAKSAQLMYNAHYT